MVESFFMFFGMEKMMGKFWKNFMIRKFRDRDVFCYVVVYDMFDIDDFRCEIFCYF